VFSGLVEDVGIIEQVASTKDGRELRVRCSWDTFEEGESIAVNGACLTVLDHGPRWFKVGAIVTTLGRTTIGSWQVGTKVNLERALRLGDRLGGHLVQGHVDGVASVTRVTQDGDARRIELALPAGMVDLMVPHGSLTVDGVSLTVNELPGGDAVEISLIDYTLRHTTLSDLKEGDSVHVEADMMGKYVQRLIAPYLTRLGS
jgi:riboflavin synthase